jgi:TonB dependent receptor
MRRLAAAIVCVAAPVVVFAQAQTVVTGHVLVRASREPVAGVVITIGNEIVATDDAGAFSVALAPGTYVAQVSADFIQPARQEVRVSATPVDVTILVDAAASATGEQIEIVDVAPTALGETKVDAKFARMVPGGGDAAKIVQSLPAVARPPAGSAEVVVWGAAPQDTRVFVDGVPVPQLFHLGGYRAAVGNDLVGDIKLAPAAFGPDRGRAIGGVIDIGLVDPEAAPRARAQADFLDGSASGRGTLGPVVVAAAVRQSWLDRAVGLVEDPAKLAPNAPLPRWSDAQVVARARLSEHLTLTSWVIAASDALDRRLVSDDPGTQTDETTNQDSVRAQVTLRHDAPDGYQAATLWVGHDRDDYLLRVGSITADRHARTTVGGGRAVQQRRLGDAATLTLGGDVDTEAATLSRTGSLTTPAREGDLHIFGQPPGDDVAADHWQALTVDAALHAALDLRWRRITGTIGARLDGWLLGASRLTPRIGATPGIGSQQILFDQDPRGTVQVQISDQVSARLDAGSYHQAREASDTSAVFGTPTLGLEQAWHVTAGGQWRHAPLALEAAVYARWLSDLVARDLAVTPPLAKSLTQAGSGTVLGLQVTARILDWRGLSGWLSYNLSRSRRTDSDMQPERFFDHDQTHGLIAVAGWNHGPWAIGGRIRLATGEPRTEVIGAFFDSRSGRFQPVRGEHNGVRLPLYFAADLRGERRIPLGAFRGAVYLEVQNLTGRANAEEIIYNADFSQRSYLTSLPLLAMVGLRIER